MMSPKAYKACWLCCVLLITSFYAHSQNFDYSVSASDGTYSSISGTPVTGNSSDWSSSSFKIPIGFNLTVNDSAFDTLSIEPNGFIKFDKNRAIVTYFGASCKADSNNVFSALSYALTGTQGNRVLKLQYEGVGYQKYNPYEYMNFQVWLYEQDSRIQIHTGPSSYPGIFDSLYIDVLPVIGMINPLMNSATSALVISGDPASPAPAPVPAGGSLQYLQFVPPSNRIYTFTPNGN